MPESGFWPSAGDASRSPWGLTSHSPGGCWCWYPGGWAWVSPWGERGPHGWAWQEPLWWRLLIGHTSSVIPDRDDPGPEVPADHGEAPDEEFHEATVALKRMRVGFDPSDHGR